MLFAQGVFSTVGQDFTIVLGLITHFAEAMSQ
jgi:hypothetical protein